MLHTKVIGKSFLSDTDPIKGIIMSITNSSRHGYSHAMRMMILNVLDNLKSFVKDFTIVMFWDNVNSLLTLYLLKDDYAIQYGILASTDNTEGLLDSFQQDCIAQLQFSHSVRFFRVITQKCTDIDKNCDLYEWCSSVKKAKKFSDIRSSKDVLFMTLAEKELRWKDIHLFMFE